MAAIIIIDLLILQ